MSSNRNHRPGAESHGDDTDDGTERYRYEDARPLDEQTFEGESIDRRTFLGVAAATGAALTLPGAAAAEVTGEPVTDEYEFVVNHTPDDYEAATVIEFTDVAALEAFAEEYEEEPDPGLERPPKAVTRETPTLAAHAHLTAEEVDEVLEMGGIEYMDFSPGANPWWKLDGSYEDGVFPPVEEARNYLSYQETVQALDHLESHEPDRVRVTSIGHSPGWNNQLTGDDPDPRDIYVAEVTKDVRDEDSFAQKNKVVFSLNIHGDERAGTEIGCRLIEEIAKGEADDFEHLLEDVAVIFLFTNPDGWVSRKPQTEIPWVEDHDTNFQRGNASYVPDLDVGGEVPSPVDTNRQYPTMGWTNPAFWPAEPKDAPDVRPGYEELGLGYEDVVPDSLAIVDHFREYDNVEFLCDYHGMYTADHMVFNLETNAPFDHQGTHDLDEVNVRIGEGMQDEWGNVDDIADDISKAGEEMYGAPFVPGGETYGGLFDWGTIYDSLSYQISGGFLGWAGQPEAFGGLGAVTVAPEVVLSNHVTDAQKEWKPYWSRHYVTAYRISMREYAEMTAAETNSTVATDGQDTAYVTSNDLTRRSADLPHTDEGPGRVDGPGQDRATEVRRRHDVVQPGPDGPSSVSTAATDASHSLFVHLHGVREGTSGVIRLKNPAGNVVEEIDLAAKADPADHTARKHDFEEFFVRRPQPGEWEIEVSDADTDVLVDVTTLETEGEIPDPEAVLGYEQREYVVNPLRFFADLEPYVEDGAMDRMGVHHVSRGRLLRGNSGQRHYDKLVVSHDDGIDDHRYVAAIEEFVEAGGDLVLTDTGVNLLGELEVGEAAAIDAGDIETTDVMFATLEDRSFDNPLLAAIRPRQQELWKGSQLGYTSGVDQPATVVDREAFEAAGGETAGTIAGGVGAGMLAASGSEINVLGSVLPPARQTELHPFGMADYAVSFMGHTLICNALGFEQRRYVDGELVGTWGEIR
ncbi:M14 family zinc carboxypeptidase [Halobiforma nitratireducens]|uniref:Peptidase M14 carboxypeptidase A n=1 Tax=Halobiforma nitratireducens JCM 10879 TaxID=1227454 RepID=M0MMM3_9EURY|nr:M14 family zinc carboxypeptidase [Halobiforma nitratireducens]EMA45984.1 peptidase M14 carboxypeptidase A [Halobiforma nitratireducens JCM 10879]